MPACRVLMAVPKYPFPIVGGLERQSHELAKALVRRGHTVHVVSGRFDTSQNDVEWIDGIRIHRLKWIEFRPIRFLLFPFSLVRALARIRRDVDLVHVHNASWFGLFVMLFAKAVHIPVISKLPNIGAFGIPGMLRRPFGRLQIAVLKGCDAIVAMTPESTVELDSIGYPPARILKVTNGIPVHPMSSALPRSSKAVHVIFVGRVSPEKGLSDLLHAWKSLECRTVHSIKLHLVGEGPQEGELRALARALGISETVELCGYCADVPAELAKADLFVLPSYAEGNSNAILEAMLAGLPIVATRLGGTSIQIGPEGHRFLVAPGDRQALSDRLLDLIDDAPLRRRLGVAMRTRIESMFAIDRVAGIYEKAYELMLSNRCEQIGGINATLFDPTQSDRPPCAG